MILRAFFLALSQLVDPRFRRVLLIGIGLTLALLIGAYAAVLWLIEASFGDGVTLPVLGEVTWVDDLLTLSSFFLMLVLSIFLMVPVASAITSMFLDDVAQAVEDRHYPTLPPARRVPFTEALTDTLNFLALVIVVNALALVIYLSIAPLAPFIFWAVNGFLLGREYFVLAASRRIGRDAARQLRRDHIATIWAAGTLMAIPLSVPLVNLLIPILGAATFTHMFHMLHARAAPDRSAPDAPL